jgi:pimeloyl-ACP methyl ester carboxylesterase
MTGVSFKQRTIKTPRHRTAWIEAGPESGPLMIFLHGWPELGVVWRGQMQHFAAQAVFKLLNLAKEATPYPRVNNDIHVVWNAAKTLMQ